MKHIKLFFTSLFFTLLLSHCAQLQSVQTAFNTKPKLNSESVKKAQPKHEGEGRQGSYGLYDYTVYRESISIRATSAVVTITAVEVYDLNRDGMFDSVFVLDHGNWKFASTLGPEYRLIANTADKSVLRDYLGLANYARKKIREQRTREQKALEREAGTCQKQLYETFLPSRVYYPE